MFEDLDAATEQPPDDEANSSWWIGRWAHVIAMVVFCLLYFPFDAHFWSWQVAITFSYIAFEFCCTCGMAFSDSDDFFGNLQVPEYIAKLLTRQILVLCLVSLGAYLWHFLKSVLPGWVTQSHRMSLWDLCGIVLAYIVAVRQASWMALRIKRRFAESVN